MKRFFILIVDCQNQGNQTDQTQQAASQGVDKKLAGRVPSLRAAPNSDQKEERNQCELKEYIEQNQIERAEHA